MSGPEQHGHAGHSHGPTLARAGERHRTPLLISFVLIAVFFVVEAVAGLLTGSLALLSDAGHMLTDVIGLGMALAAIQLASRFSLRDDRPHDGHTFGVYRLEILAAFVNALLLFGVAIWVLIEAARRLFDESEVIGMPMLIVATLGLVVNLIAFALLREGAKESLNVEGAYLEVLADTVGSVGVIVAAVLVQGFGWNWADPVMAMLIGTVDPAAYLAARSTRGTGAAAGRARAHRPGGARPTIWPASRASVDVHDLHVWTLTSEMEAASAHLVVPAGADQHAVLDRARELLAVDYSIEHGTFQVEPDDHLGCNDLTW